MTTSLFTRILFATDFSEDARRAQEYAIHLAGAWGAELEVLHVIEAPHGVGADAESFAMMERSRTAAAQQLEEVRDDLARRGIPARVRLLLGNPGEHIRQAVREKDMGLIVLGAQGRHNLLYGLIGKTVERLVHEGPCPILAVPGARKDAVESLPSDRLAVIRQVLAPLDFSAPSLDAVEYAVHLAQGVGAAVTLMHVLEPACYDLDWGLGVIEGEASKRDYWNRQLMEIRDVITAFGIPVEVEISAGLPSDTILASALRHHTDLIVMGTHGRRGMSSKECGSVAEAVLRRATCPVLTIKTAKFEPGHRRVVPHVLDRPVSKGDES
ncbi:MAG: universal stress protein [Nitrospira sp.]|nr:universal stress protein [Nitrospira sp.]